MKKILCLDFDGVICDSQKECLLVAYNAYNILERKSLTREINLDSIPAQIRDQFLANRFLVRPAKEYWLLMDLIIKRLTIPNQKCFNSLANSYKNKLHEFENTFFRERQFIRENATDKWLSLHRIYPEFTENWTKLKTEFNVYIVTNKGSSTVSQLLGFFEINILKSMFLPRLKKQP